MEVAVETERGTDEPVAMSAHRPWAKIVTLVVLGAFLLSILVGALLL
ncbi:hypothetical protein ACFPBZ_01720 [Actinomycetospora atypica]|uniref:Uncharacterized protein n=1 Tax=Actinomycetospora atypica TaxID=1290095 RepID=A0ABV9YG11_9PSEU